MKRYVISLLFIVISSCCFAQTKLPMYCGKYTILKDSAFVYKQLYKLDKIYEHHRSYIRKDSTLVVERGGDCFIKLLTNAEFKEYMHVTDSVINLFKVYPPIIQGEIIYSDFIDYIKIYLPKLDSLMSINYSEMSNCISISNTLDKQIFLDKKQITPLMYEYKHKFDSIFNLQAINLIGYDINIGYSYSKIRTYQFDKIAFDFARMCKKIGYNSSSKNNSITEENVLEDIYNFYKSCPIKYNFLVEEELYKTSDIRPNSMRHSVVPLFFFLSSPHNQVIHDWPDKEK
ncbi:hypothetical protein [Bernardetia sp.]|uniref:hypothetical protein n=1 Tax=Bernardetia sp. TaxID=1937974 RepID=UPI0025BC219E|nr:hypothetical protein [Bernardetia sp.]